MRKIVLVVAIALFSISANAQIIPSVDFGLKAGFNFTKLSEESYKSENRTGSLVGLWARVGAMGLHFQPELYYTVKRAEVKDVNNTSTGSSTTKVNFSSFDMPLLVGTKIGAAGLAGRLNTGPVISFIIDEEQSSSSALSNAAKFNYKNQAMAWQFGAGLDVRKISVDLRYELGLSNISRPGYEDTKLRLFNVSLGYKLF